MNKLAKFIEETSLEDLQLIKKDLEAGNIQRVLEKELKKKQANKLTLCPVCNAPIREGEGYHLQFGSRDFRQKATFDGPDCLAYFLERKKKRN